MTDTRHVRQLVENQDSWTTLYDFEAERVVGVGRFDNRLHYCVRLAVQRVEATDYHTIRTMGLGVIAHEHAEETSDSENAMFDVMWWDFWLESRAVPQALVHAFWRRNRFEPLLGMSWPDWRSEWQSLEESGYCYEVFDAETLVNSGASQGF